MKILGSPAHRKAQRLYSRNRLSSRAVLEELQLGIGYDDIVEFILPVVRRFVHELAPGSEEERLTGRIVGCAVSLAVVLVEQERIISGRA